MKVIKFLLTNHGRGLAGVEAEVLTEPGRSRQDIINNAIRRITEIGEGLEELEMTAEIGEGLVELRKGKK